MPRPLWTLPMDAAPRGLCLAREARRLLVWTETNWLFWTNHKGERQAQTHAENGIVGAAVSEDGSAFVLVEANGRFSWLAPDLRPRWDRLVKGKPTALAVDPLGIIAAVATNQSQILFIYADGEIAREVACPRPAQHLAFIPGTATLIAAADLGWVAAYDLEIGDWLWRDAPVATIGGLAVAGSGEPILLACFSEGLRGYHADGKPWKFANPVPFSRGIAATYDGKVLVNTLADGTLAAQNLEGKPRFTYQPEATTIAMAMDSLGEMIYLAQLDRRLVALVPATVV